MWKQSVPLARGMEIGYIVKDPKRWSADPDRTAFEFDAEYHRKLLEVAWEEAVLLFG